MVNAHRGEVEIKAPSGTFTLRLSINAIAEIENLLDLGINEIAARLGDPATMRIAHLRAIVWGGLREKHDLTLFEVGDLISDAGIEAVTDAVQQAFTLAFPKAEEGSVPSPATGQGGTGKAS